MVAGYVMAVQGGKVVDRVNGAHVPELAKKTAAHDKIPVLPLSVLSQAVPPKEVSVGRSCDTIAVITVATGLGFSAEKVD